MGVQPLERGGFEEDAGRDGVEPPCVALGGLQLQDAAGDHGLRDLILVERAGAGEGLGVQAGHGSAPGVEPGRHQGGRIAGGGHRGPRDHQGFHPLHAERAGEGRPGDAGSDDRHP